ncbi:MAG TPA: hypothetical protein ENK18_21960 [Deltaproteobacteria bacterium]|nr:hypothetical protein [Deltaproteobacteria bacterium]
MTLRYVAPIVWLCSCVSAESLQWEWEAFLLDHQDCVEDVECAVVYPGCPLGCAAAVRADAVDEAEARIAELLKQYERSGRGCSYECVEHTPPACVQGLCFINHLSDSSP